MNTRLLTAALLCTLCAMACRREPSQHTRPESFDSVTAVFTLTRSRIKADQKLEVHGVFRNQGEKTTIFRFYEPAVNALLYVNGKELGDLCPTADNPILSVTLKPGETHEFTDELFTTRCYNLAPGRYSIRFNYSLRLLANEGLRIQYDEKYDHPYAGVVPWDGRDHPFTVIK